MSDPPEDMVRYYKKKPCSQILNSAKKRTGKYGGDWVGVPEREFHSNDDLKEMKENNERKNT